jgi:hypothetical protein
MMVRGQLLHRYGGFDERFFMYEEDLELSLRIQESGSKIWYEPSAVIKHVGQGSMRKNGEKFSGLLWPDNPNLSFYVFHIIKNRLINMSMNARGTNRLIFMFFFPFLVLKLCGQYMIRRRWDGLKAMVQAFIAFRKQCGSKYER